MARLHGDVSDELKRRYKIAAVKAGLGMAQLVARVLEQQIERVEKQVEEENR